MKFKQYLKEMSYEDFMMDNHFASFHLISYLTEMKINYKDSSIKKNSSYDYKFIVNKTDYSFKIKEIEYLPGLKTYTVYFGPNKGMDFDRVNKHNIVQVRKVFEKVITCMIYFINDLKPDEFTITGHDEKLYKTYKMIIAVVQTQKPFSNYKIDDSGRGFTLKKVKEF